MQGIPLTIDATTTGTMRLETASGTATYHLLSKPELEQKLFRVVSLYTSARRSNAGHFYVQWEPVRRLSQPKSLLEYTELHRFFQHVKPSASEVSTSTVTTDPSTYLQGAFCRLDDMAALGPNWDSYGADTVSPKAIKTARSLLIAIAARFETYAAERIEPFFVGPLASGGVLLEWHGAHRDVEVEIEPTGELGYLLIDHSHEKKSFVECENASRAAVLNTISDVISW